MKLVLICLLSSYATLAADQPMKKYYTRRRAWVTTRNNEVDTQKELPFGALVNEHARFIGKDGKAVIKRDNEAGEYSLSWIPETDLVPTTDVKKAAVITNFEIRDGGNKGKVTKAKVGDLVLIRKQEKESCQVELIDQVSGTAPCGSLSTEKADVAAADTVEWIEVNAAGWFVESGIKAAQAALQQKDFRFAGRLKAELPELQKKLARKKKEEASPDFQMCSAPTQPIRGDTD